MTFNSTLSLLSQTTNGVIETSLIPKKLLAINPKMPQKNIAEIHKYSLLPSGSCTDELLQLFDRPWLWDREWMLVVAPDAFMVGWQRWTSAAGCSPARARQTSADTELDKAGMAAHWVSLRVARRARRGAGVCRYAGGEHQIVRAWQREVRLGGRSLRQGRNVLVSSLTRKGWGGVPTLPVT